VTTRRQFLLATAALPVLTGSAAITLSHKERIDRALKGAEVDRPPFSFWHHFGLEKEAPEKFAGATIDFHRHFRTDLVKVMSDFPYPKPDGTWYELKSNDNPFPQQIHALELIRDAVADDAYFVETIFNPYKVAENLSSAQEVNSLRETNPKALLNALELIAQSEASHAKRAIAAGASGIFLAIANADSDVMPEKDYAKFSEPFDRMVLKAVSGSPLNILHLHGDHVYLNRFTGKWPAAAINYSAHGTKVPISVMRERYSGVLMGGLDEKNFRSLNEDRLRDQWQAAQSGAGKKFILAPGCSVPNDSTDAELNRLPQLLNA
jgi:uroporphyrinogen decarboxylase